MPLARTLLALLIASLLAGPPAGAQQASPTPGVEPCAVPHRDIAAIVVVLNPPATPAASPHAESPTRASPPAAPIEPVGTPRLLRPELPAGDPVAPEVVAGLTETMQRYVACANAGDVIGLMSLVSDEFLRFSFGQSILTEAELQAYVDAGQALPLEQRRRLVAVREARQLPDGRVAALVDTARVTSTNPAAIQTDLVTFTQVDGLWLIDQYLAGVTSWYGPNATPTP